MTVYLIDENYLKSYTPISGNVDIAQLLPFVEVSQQTFVQHLLGTKLYREVTAAVAGGTVTAEQATLLSFVRPALAWHALSRALPFLHAQVRPKGVVEGDGEGARQTSLATVQFLRQEALANAEFLGQRVVKYLCDSRHMFPSYDDASQDVGPAVTAYRSPVAFDRDALSQAELELLRRYLG